MGEKKILNKHETLFEISEIIEFKSERYVYDAIFDKTWKDRINGGYRDVDVHTVIFTSEFISQYEYYIFINEIMKCVKGARFELIEHIDNPTKYLLGMIKPESTSVYKLLHDGK